MAIVINGSGTVTGLSVGGLPDGTVDADTLASGAGGVDGVSSSADATAITIDSSENVGIGVVPEDWHSAYDGGIVQINSQGGIFSQGAETYVTNNVYEPQSGGMKHINTNVATLYSQQTGVHYFKTAASGSADAAITWTTGFEVLNDGKARAKNGLLFGTDTAAANALDDYEEGTWTAGYSGATASGGQFTGYYIRIGRVCHYQYYSGAMTFSSITGTGTITGLPFTSSNLGYAAGTFVHGDAWGDSDGLHVGLNDTNIYCVTAGATTYRDFVAGSKYLMITGTYIIKEGS